MRLTFYTRTQCPLCEDAKLVLKSLQREYPFEVEEVDISRSDKLTEEYGLMIPVVKMEGKMIQYGLIDPVTIE
ncbi:MAG TPA: glutaredoxin family protein, partial [Bacillaceae bacterium]